VRPFVRCRGVQPRRCLDSENEGVPRGNGTQTVKAAGQEADG